MEKLVCQKKILSVFWIVVGICQIGEWSWSWVSLIGAYNILYGMCAFYESTTLTQEPKNMVETYSAPFWRILALIYNTIVAGMFGFIVSLAEIIIITSFTARNKEKLIYIEKNI